MEASAFDVGADATVGIIGAGRLGSSLAAALRDAGRPLAALSRTDPEEALATSAHVPGTVGTDDPQIVVESADVVFITTNDDAIGSVAGSLRLRAGQAVVHCSGATPVGALADLKEQGVAIGGFHPLQTFPKPLEGGRFDGITVGVTSDEPTLYAWLEVLADQLGATSILVPDDARAMYHAAATLTSPLLAGLAGMAASMWASFGVPRAAALEALAPLLQSTASDVGSMSYPDGITGPYVRGDVEVVEAHLSALRVGSEDVARAYAALALATLPDSAESGGLSSTRRREIEQLLRTFLEEVS